MITTTEHQTSIRGIAKYIPLYFCVFLSLALLLCENILAYQAYEIIFEIMSSSLSVLLIVIMVYFYFARARFLSLQLLYAYAFSLIIGIPAIYLLIFRELTHGFELVCLWCILLNVILYFSSFSSRVVSQGKSVNTLFTFLFYVVGFCQLFKTFLYFKFIIGSGLGHLAIYTEGDALIAQVPFVIRAISGFSLIMSLATFYFRAPTSLRLISFLLLASELLIGIRSKFFFSLICIIVLSLYSLRYIIKNKFVKISRIQNLAIGFILFSLISYFREGYEINFVSYLIIVLDSLSSTLAGLQDVFVLPVSQGWDKIDANIIFTQIFPISGLGFISDSQIYKEFSLIVLGDISSGIALSSSGILEATVLNIKFSFFIYLCYLLCMLAFIQKCLNSSLVILNFIAIAMLPGLFYSIRGELVLPFAYIIKSFPIILLAPLLTSCSNKVGNK
ncbi:oligosaccharide repeat unit polymerase [Citrobacter sp. Cs237]|uniref:oligosaccharide repeat unit polymerase n=1 Tax=Citrobacter sp. Cs237 TaxID=2985156 RepID=UPI0025770E1E|nr:oligosaccharide repeat unit polymerase [Citrobacter sp. Cs237]MDM2748561.1 oligosaccharide repeat unit polymerase [Citrobacter sp. Cs237]